MSEYDPNHDLKLLETSWDSLQSAWITVGLDWQKRGVEIPDEIKNAGRFITLPNPFAGHTLRFRERVSEQDLGVDGKGMSNLSISHSRNER